jgi:gluconolactonase
VPDPSPFEFVDERFKAAVARIEKLEVLATGCRWAEGPAYFAAGRYLLWSDIPNDRILRYDECDGHVSVFRQPANHSNGNTVDRDGRLVTCEHATRRVTRTEHDGSITIIADRYEGLALNSPNDVVVKSDGSIWFSDPCYGIDSAYQGLPAKPAQAGQFLFVVDSGGRLRKAADTLVQPNGLAFSPDERLLYVVDSGHLSRPGGPHHIRRFAVSADNELTDLGILAECDDGGFDGLRVDTDGRLWAAASNGVHCIAADGTLLGRIRLPGVTANVEFGGARRNYLYICCTDSLYGVMVRAQGLRRT